MSFSSEIFLFLFLPLIYIFYLALAYLTKEKISLLNTFLVLVSLIFYAYGEPIFVLVMVFSVILNEIIAGLIVKKSNRKKVFLIISLVWNLGLLGIFKYLAFICNNIFHLLGIVYEVKDIHLPVGISFFTFQIISYVVDVYKEEKNYQKSFLKVLLYVSFFPQLIAGPIVKYHDINKYINNRKLKSDEIALGIQRFILGLFKKIIIANSLGKFVDTAFGMSYENLPTSIAWIGAILYTLQIYYDFSGYSDMAIGLGHMFGFTFKENFENPLLSASIKEFWRKWHISLSSWFREYLYIPLGGNRKGGLVTKRNKLMVFFFTGLWHGASWNFIFWGMIHGISLVLEEIFLKNKKRGFIKKIWGHIYTFLIVCIAFVWFRADTFLQGWMYFIRMFSLNYISDFSMNQLIPFFTPFYLVAILLALIGCIPQVQRKAKKTNYAISIILYIVCLLAIAGDSYSPFIYFRF